MDDEDFADEDFAAEDFADDDSAAEDFGGFAEVEDVVYTAPARRRRPGWITAGLLGVEEALYGVRKNEIVMVADADGMPEPDFEINLTPDPRDSTVVLKSRRR